MWNIESHMFVIMLQTNLLHINSFAQKSCGKNIKTEILIVKIEKKRCNFPKMVDESIQRSYSHHWYLLPF